jgi:hypothetical protein
MPHALQPRLDEAARLQLGQPRYTVSLLPGPPPSAGNGHQAEQPHPQHQQQGQVEEQPGPLSDQEQRLLEAAQAASAFRRMAAAAAGMPAAAGAGNSVAGQQERTGEGRWVGTAGDRFGWAAGQVQPAGGGLWHWC